MNRTFGIFTALLMAFCLMANCSGKDEVTAIRERGSLRVGVKSDVPRFALLNMGTGALEGMEIDLARALAKDILGNENAVRFIIVGSAQMRAALLLNGEIDVAVATFTITEERKKIFNFSRSYFTDELSCLVRAGSNIKKLEELDGKTAGVVRATTAATAFKIKSDKMGIKVSVSEYSSYPETKQALINGKIDAVVSDKSILLGYADEGHVLLDYGFNPQEYGIASKLSNKKLAARIDTLLGKMEKNGELAAIMQKWDLLP